MGAAEKLSKHENPAFSCTLGNGDGLSCHEPLKALVVQWKWFVIAGIQALINFPLLALTLIQWAPAARCLVLTPGNSSSGFQGCWWGHSSEKSILAHGMVQRGRTQLAQPLGSFWRISCT